MVGFPGSISGYWASDRLWVPTGENIFGLPVWRLTTPRDFLGQAWVTYKRMESHIFSIGTLRCGGQAVRPPLLFEVAWRRQ